MPEQALLFDIHPEGTEPPIPQRVITTGCLLPFPHNQVVDARRAAAILKVGPAEVRRLIHHGYISGHKLNQQYRISYQSIVDFCDRLRLQHAIRDRRPKLAPGRRWRDDSLLPFPASDTVGIREVMTGLDLHMIPAIRITEEGAFEAYYIPPNGVWRISKTSLYAYRDRIRDEIEQRKARPSSPRR